mmetsp:Transcript_69309/g.192983  ORF Transcript_69309/g.192983 Transcript_69309/m.192983 type:complete len:213 (+) Transcript_69309:313-951(+)
MHDQSITVRIGERLKVLFEVSLRGRGTAANGHGAVLKVVPARACFEEARSCFIDTCDQQTHSIGPPGSRLRLLLRFVGHLADQAAHSHGRVVNVFVVQTLAPHVLCDDTCVCSESRDADAHIVIDFVHLLLVFSELRLRALEGGDDDMRVRDEAQDRGSLLHRFHGVLDLQDTACRAPCDAIGVVLVVSVHGRCDLGSGIGAAGGQPGHLTP